MPVGSCLDGIMPDEMGKPLPYVSQTVILTSLYK